MTETKHTPEPWKVIRADVEGMERAYICQVNESSPYVARVVSRPIDTRDANAARIVAAEFVQAQKVLAEVEGCNP
ncbi:unnamed protein product [marine sediment metagenome]|uniref:Uncharacterized protein n=1 Tax=marine sediment metagenome TaxID=412755 RepID=X0VIY1_9ZZZZ